MDSGELVGQVIGYYILCLPAVVGLSWAVFQLIKNTGLTRPTAVVVSCLTVFLVSQVLGNIGRLSHPLSLDSPSLFHELVAVIIAAIIGLVFWGKKKDKNPPPESNVQH